ncbi:enoyl-CoA hydratase-related protein [Hydrogenophaga sp. BPS33]|uniref:enoyl-CoA hydratase-related protein n=1 Tax=Hydrogenophaga sp. BPS33 TaxID=2651974 RepID=UPI00135BDC71|nr:enoyl-CoA hydratase-related protein [Hydrogenophaga sp. BPS33]
MTSNTTSSAPGVAPDGVLCEVRDGVLHITINRPERHNTMTQEMLRQLAQAFDSAGQRRDLDAVVLTGAGSKTFCAGGQLTSSQEGRPFDLDAERFDHPVADLFRAIERCPHPVVGRINGSAFGGGVGLVCACDIAIGATGALFGTTEGRVGLFPMMILPALQRVIPRRALIEMCFYAERFGTEKAVHIGLLNSAVPPEELDAAVDQAIARLRLCAPTALQIGRRALNAASDLSYADALNYTQALLPLLAQSADAQEGFRAFAERRPANWRQRSA